LNIKSTRSNSVTNKVIIDSNVFGTIMLDWIDRHISGADIVTV